MEAGDWASIVGMLGGLSAMVVHWVMDLRSRVDRIEIRVDRIEKEFDL